jgi:hypothetical protein
MASHNSFVLLLPRWILGTPDADLEPVAISAQPRPRDVQWNVLPRGIRVGSDAFGLRLEPRPAGTTATTLYHVGVQQFAIVQSFCARAHQILTPKLTSQEIIIIFVQIRVRATRPTLDIDYKASYSRNFWRTF